MVKNISDRKKNKSTNSNVCERKGSPYDLNYVAKITNPENFNKPSYEIIRSKNPYNASGRIVRN